MASISSKTPLLLRLTGAITTLAAVLLRRNGARSGTWLPVALAGAGQLAASAAAGRRAAGALASGGLAENLPTAGEGVAASNGRPGGPVTPAPASSVAPASPTASASSVAPASAAAPAPSAPSNDDDFVAQQESAAAAEAAAIGGWVPSETGDPAMDPVYEAGGGEQEGFEAAEEELIENATHDSGRGQPEQDAFSPEAEADRSTAVYGEPDEAKPEDQ